MKTNYRVLLLTVLVGLVLVTAGCTSASNDDSNAADEFNGSDANLEELSGEELLTESQEVMQNVETATFEMEISTEASTGSFDMSGTGAMNVPEEKMRMNVETELMGESVEIQQYIIGETIYINSQGQWTQQDISQMPGQANMWEQNQLQGINASDVGDVSLGEQTTINGNDVQALNIDADWEAIQEAMIQQGGQSSMPQQNLDVSNIEMTQYVDLETGAIRQLDMSMTATQSGQEVQMDMTFTYDNINQPVDIELPEEAENAPESSVGT